MPEATAYTVVVGCLEGNQIQFFSILQLRNESPRTAKSLYLDKDRVQLECMDVYIKAPVFPIGR